MNPASVVDWIESRDLPATALTFAAATLIAVLAWGCLDRTKPDAANEDAVKAHTRRRRIRFTVAGTASTTAFIVLLVWGPWWIEGHHLRDDKGNLVASAGIIVTGFRTMLIAAAAGGFTAGGLYYTREKHRLERNQFKHAQDQFELAQAQFTENQKQFETTLKETQTRDKQQTKLTREGQVTGRYVETIKLLAAPGPHEKLGGIYSLERIMKDSDRDRNTIAEVLAAYVRQRLNGTASETSRHREIAEEIAAAEERGHGVDPDVERPPLAPLSEDIRTALGVLSRNCLESAYRPDLRRVILDFWDAEEAQLQGARMIGAQLNGAQLRNAALTGADLREAEMYLIKLTGADLSEARLDDANLTHGTLQRAQFVGATLRSAYLQDAKAMQVNFTRADLTSARLHRARLGLARFDHATLTDAGMRNAGLDGADLASAIGVTPSQLCQAYIYRSTKLPEQLANDFWVQARISECDEAKDNRKPPPDWTPPSTSSE
ncbi:pentapeptide repeat-containing protein [Streptomyces parvulus]|uniref:pentapeptide repeat-containing protein n=1 Tax=Streptomyces parvulus TaxID=146923 RepID=UPI0033F03B3C